MRYSGQSLGRELIKQGLVPDGCRNVQLSIPADGMALLHYDVMVSDDNLPKLIAALQAIQERAAVGAHDGE